MTPGMIISLFGILVLARAVWVVIRLEQGYVPTLEDIVYARLFVPTGLFLFMGGWLIR